MRNKEKDRLPEKEFREPGEKKGLARFMELVDRDGPKFLKAGALVFLALIPYTAVVVMAVASGSPLFLLGCIPAGMLAAPFLCGAADTVMRSLRDEVGWWWWDSYKTSWKRNARACLLPGGLFGLIGGLELFLLYIIAMQPDPVKDFWLLMAAVLAEFAILTYYLPMLVCMDIPFPALLRNCFVLFFSHPIKSILAAIVQIVYYGIILIWFPLTSVVFLLFSVWFPMVICYLTLYPVLDKHFGLKAAYEEIRRRHWESGDT